MLEDMGGGRLDLALGQPRIDAAVADDVVGAAAAAAAAAAEVRVRGPLAGTERQC